MNKNEIIGYIGCIIAGLGLFLPFLEVLTIGVNFIEGDGKIVLVGLIICAIFIFAKMPIITLVASLLCVAITGYDLFNAFSEVDFSSVVQIGVGTYIIGVGLTLIIISSILQIKNNKNKKVLQNIL